MIKFTVLSENYASKVNSSEWGFSLLVETDDKTILFDTGQDGHTVLNNAKELNIDLNKIDGIVLSHGHYDHTGGLKTILDSIGGRKTHVHPSIFTTRHTCKNGIKKTSNTLEPSDFNKDIFVFCGGCHKLSSTVYLIGNIPLVNDFEKISKSFTKEDGGKDTDDFFDDEIVLAIDSPKGIIVVTGCAHRGIVNICEHVKAAIGGSIHGIVGGTHLYEAKQEHFSRVVDYFKKENLQLLSPSHCTGMDRIYELKNIFGDIVRPSFCGETIELG